MVNTICYVILLDDNTTRWCIITRNP